MYLVRLIYASRISDEFRINDLKGIVKTAVRRNAANDITGLLCFNRNYFLQCIEGERSVVNETFNLICRDSRHEKVTLVSYEDITEREFTDWAMEYVPESKVSMALTRKYSAGRIFKPFEMSGESCLMFIRAIRGASQWPSEDVAGEDADMPSDDQST